MNRTKQLGLSLLTLLCCLTATAQDPSVTKCEYWFDQQYDSRITATMSGGTWNSSIPIADMGYGLHSIAFRVFDSNGQASSTLVKNFIKLESTSTGINPLNTYEYWIDQQFDKRKSGTVPASGVVSFEEDLTTLNYGLHNVTIRVIDAVGKVSSALTKNFIKLETTATGTNPLKTYEYWIDQQFDKRKSGTLDATGIVNIDEDITALDYGLHNVTIRVIDAVGRVSSALTKNFIKLETTASGLNPLKTYEYWIDQQFDERKSGTVPATGVVEFDYDLSALAPGLHNIAIRVIDEVGKVSSVLTKNFIVLEQLEGDNALATYEYWIDDEFDSRKSAEVPADGVVNLDIDITDRGVGMHTFNYRTIDKAGYPSAVVYKSFFVKKIVEDANLIAIDYWFNDEPRTRIAIDPAQASIDKNDIVIPLDDLKPRTISEEYVFDATQKKVITTETVTVGFQVFNNEEVGSEAYVETLENMSFTVDPAFVALDNEVSDTKAAPKGGDVQGFSYAGAVDDSLHWEITTESDAKIDFYDADGNKITPEAKTINEKNVLVMKMPTESVYVLVYGATQDGDITIKVAQPIELAVIDATRAYGAENPTFTYSTKGAAVAGEVAFTTEATAASGVGEYTVSIDGSGITNSYVTLKSGKLTITKAPLTIKAKDYTIKQGEELPTLEMEYEGFKNGETAEVLTTQATIATTATSASEPGTYDITVSGAEAANYELTFVKGTLTIAAADPVTITAKSYEIEYGDELPTFEFTSEGAALVGTPAITCDIPEGAPAGTYPIEISKGGVTNYNDAYVNGTLTITKAKLTITADDIEVHQDEVMPTLTWKAEGWKNGEDESVLTVQPVCTTEGSPTSSLGDYTITIGGAEAANYDITYVNGKLTVSVPVGITSIDANVAPADIYTLQGIKVRSKSESLDGLADGYYIVNRRKVLIRRR
jgi:hypothetical protein